jgi:hypothetical protein
MFLRRTPLRLNNHRRQAHRLKCSGRFTFRPLNLIRLRRLPHNRITRRHPHHRPRILRRHQRRQRQPQRTLRQAPERDIIEDVLMFYRCI